MGAAGLNPCPPRGQGWQACLHCPLLSPWHQQRTCSFGRCLGDIWGLHSGMNERRAYPQFPLLPTVPLAPVHAKPVPGLCLHQACGPAACGRAAPPPTPHRSEHKLLLCHQMTCRIPTLRIFYHLAGWFWASLRSPQFPDLKKWELVSAPRVVS